MYCNGSRAFSLLQLSAESIWPLKNLVSEIQTVLCAFSALSLLVEDKKNSRSVKSCASSQKCSLLGISPDLKLFWKNDHFSRN